MNKNVNDSSLVFIPDADSKPYEYSCKLLDKTEEEWSQCYGYKRNIAKTVLYFFCCLISGGILLLISYWMPRWKLKMTHSVSFLSVADTVLIVDHNGTIFVEEVHLGATDLATEYIDGSSYIYFWYKHHKFYYYAKEREYRHLEGVDSNQTFFELTHDYHGIPTEERAKYLTWFGKNNIDVKVKSVGRLFFEECADPFYIFQVCSVILWAMEDYYYYAIAIIGVSLGSVVISIYQTRKHLKTLRNMIAKSGDVQVLTPGGKIETINSLDIVPGDLLLIPKNGGTMHCDAVLISGTAIVNESMLTGESLPVTKTAITKPSFLTDSYNEVYDCIKHKRNTLFSGTDVLQTRYYGNENVVAVVVRSGFSTMKGNLLRSILFPKPIAFQFFKDALMFVGVLSIFGLLGLVYTIYVFIKVGASAGEIVKKSLDVITIAVPPSLPAAMSVGTVYALQRLARSNIFCINPSRVNISGKIKLFCFDKTGTLTEDGLDFCGFIRSEHFGFHDMKSDFQDTLQSDDALVGMASCHSLTIIDGKLTGDPLDLKMFEATDWEMEEIGEAETERYGIIIPVIVKPKSSTQCYDLPLECVEGDEVMPLQVAILKQFTFSSDLQRMSVIVRRLGLPNMEVFAKGSPEMIASLCNSESLPPNFDECLKSYTQLGYRVLALASKGLPSKISWHKIQQYQRDQAECNLNFLGFIVMKNVLKPETTPIIQQLYKAKIRVVMVTGDNVLTAACVARECGMVKPNQKIIYITSEFKDGADVLHFTALGEMEDNEKVECSYEGIFEDTSFLNRNYHFAMTGKVFAIIQTSFPSLYQRVLVCGTIFARMLPDQKTSLIEGLQSLGYGVGMCGDGANDCGALKRAHAGISLSELEASVASPFTSKNPNISCVIKVIKEGRCALVTSFNIFKYMALYSMIQYATALTFYTISSNIGDIQYLYIDLFITMPFAVTMSWTGPAEKLVAKRPLGRLMHPFVLFSLISQIFLNVAFQLFIFFYVKTVPGYKPIDHYKSPTWQPGVDQILCYENTMLFCFSTFQYVIVALVFSVGKPYRQPFYKNHLFLFSGFVLTLFNCLLTVRPNSFFRNGFELLDIKNPTYYVAFFIAVFGNLLFSYIIDHALLEAKCFQRCLKVLQRKKGPRNRYKLILRDIQNDTSWPPIVMHNERPIC